MTIKRKRPRMTIKKKAPEHDREEPPGSSPRVTVVKKSPNMTIRKKKPRYDRENKKPRGAGLCFV
uniref:hypothetical protein n=1 Tax=Candidatus Scatocola faecigallinarum TaxID=2840916 RepID=UPI0040252B2F